jgi:hypothetical protein
MPRVVTAGVPIRIPDGSNRIQPVVERLLADQALRTEIFRGSDAELATALSAVDRLATSQGMLYGGFHGWNGTRV